MAELLLELGCEEMPASWLPALSEQVLTKFEELASRELIEPSSVEVLYTPRRFALAASVLMRQPDREEKVWGPSLKAAKDAKGAWTGAAQGFARKNGTTPEALLSEPRDPAKPGELNLLFKKAVPGRATAEVVPGLLSALLRGLAFPKRMSWDAWLPDGKGAFPFGRPIRWLVLMLDGQVVPYTIHHLVDGAEGPVAVKSGNVSYGHRFLPRESARQPLQIGSFGDLKDDLRTRCVLLDPRERAERIRLALEKESVAAHRELLTEWRDLVEYPAIVFGTIPEEFRKLPAAVLETVLIHHQKYVPLAGGRFAAVTNTDGSAAAEIVRGMERVVVARLRDGAFFYGEDLKRPLAERVGDLAGVTFHKGLGTYLEKAGRMVALVDRLQDRLEARVHGAAREAARLCKADLTTLMVREFTELQGVMGGIYLRAQQAAPEVADAVQWHYHPVAVERDAEPANALAEGSEPVFAVVSAADKLDTLAGYFGLGLVPTGSSDPYGLRRAAQGVVRVLLDFWPQSPRPSLRRLIADALAGYEGKTQRPAAEVARDLEAFFVERLRYVFMARGYQADEVEAVLAAREPDSLDDPREAALRLLALKAVRSQAGGDLEQLGIAFKRARNILGEQAPAAVDPARFQEDAERELWKAVQALQGQGGTYESRLRALASLRQPVDRFFDDVLVMAEDQGVRANRLGLLSQTLSLFYRIADVSRLAS